MTDETRYIGFFAAEERTFWLPMPRVVAAEREMGCSIFQVFQDIGEHLGVADGEMVLAGPSPATLKQCHALIANALPADEIGEQEARELVQTYCYPARPAIHDLALAWRILSAAIYGVKIDGSKKKGADAPRRSTKAKSSSTAG